MVAVLEVGDKTNERNRGQRKCRGHKIDVTYGEDSWEQEDDEWTEELDSMDEMDW